MVKPVFRQPEEEIERSLEQKLTERTKAIEEKVKADAQATADAAAKAAIRQLEDREVQRQKEEYERAEHKAKEEQRIRDEVEKRAKELAEQRLKEEQDRKLKEDIKLKEEQDRKLKEEQDRKLKEEQDRKLKEDIKLKEEQDRKLKEEQDRKLKEEQEHATAEPKGVETSSKIAKMIEEIKKRKTSQPEIPQQSIQQTVSPTPTIPLISPDQVIDDKDIIHCPTCHTGHIHSMEKDGITYKCTGPECEKEYVMVDKTADYKCVNCGVPVKRPSEEEKLKMDSCPFCHGKKAVRFDWNKLWKIQKAVK